MKIFSGSSHFVLAEEIAKHLKVKLSPIVIERFPDEEIFVQILESVRGEDVFVVQSLALSPNEYLMELLIVVDALKRASARSITAVIPYFCYCRQDRKVKGREPITARLIANLLTTSGVTHLLTLDLHAGQLEGFFDIPVDHLHAASFLSHSIKKLEVRPDIVLAPDIGSAKLAHKYASFFNIEFGIVDKHRHSALEVEAITVIGDVKGKVVLLADDMCSTGGTLVSAAKACHEKGASKIFAVVTHGLLVGPAVERIEKSPIEALYMSDSIPHSKRLSLSTKCRFVSLSDLFAQAIRCLVSQESIESLHY